MNNHDEMQIFDTTIRKIMSTMTDCDIIYRANYVILRNGDNYKTRLSDWCYYTIDEYIVIRRDIFEATSALCC